MSCTGGNGWAKQHQSSASTPQMPVLCSSLLNTRLRYFLWNQQWWRRVLQQTAKSYDPGTVERNLQSLAAFLSWMWSLVSGEGEEESPPFAAWACAQTVAPSSAKAGYSFGSSTRISTWKSISGSSSHCPNCKELKCLPHQQRENIRKNLHESRFLFFFKECLVIKQVVIFTSHLGICSGWALSISADSRKTKHLPVYNHMTICFWKPETPKACFNQKWNKWMMVRILHAWHLSCSLFGGILTTCK